MAQKKVAENHSPAKTKAKALRPTPRLQVVVSEPDAGPGPVCRGSLYIYGLVGRELNQADRETFMVLHLDSKCRLLAKEIVSVGSQNAAIIHPREVFKGAVLNGSASIVCVHNHPSGDPTPSREDKEVTVRLKEAGELLGVELRDHIIIGKGANLGYYSFVDAGSMPPNVAAKGVASAAGASVEKPCCGGSAWSDVPDRLHDVHAKTRFLAELNWETLSGNQAAQYGHALIVRELADAIQQIEEDLDDLSRQQRSTGTEPGRAVMQVDLSQEEQELIENYRRADEEGKEAVRWATEVAARVQEKRK